MVGDENDERIGIGILAVLLDRCQFFFVGAAAKKVLHAAYEEHLKRSHQRRRAGAVENLRQVRFPEIEFEKAEVSQVGGNQMFENGITKTLAEESLVAHEHVRRTHPARLKLAHKTIGLGEGAHLEINSPQRTQRNQASSGVWSNLNLTSSQPFE